MWQYQKCLLLKPQGMLLLNFSKFTTCRSVVHLFSSKGFTTLINDNLLDNILTMGHLVVGVVSMFLAYFYCLLVNLGPHTIETFMLTCGGFVTGYLMCMLTLNIVSSATSTVYVCFAENSLSLQVFNL